MPTLEQLYGKSLRGGLPIAVASRMRPPAPEEGELPEVDPSLVSRVGSTVGGGLSAAANILDLPGSSVRDILAWENPFDQWWTPSRPDNRTTGRDLARKWGVAGKDDTWGNFGGGLAAEIALDPLTYTGVGLFTKAGTALSKAGLAKSVKTIANESAEGLARQSGKTLGKKKLGELGARMRMTPRQVIEGSEDVLDAKSKWLMARGKLTIRDAFNPNKIDELNPAKIDAAWDLTKDSDELLDKPIQSIASFRLPFMKEPLELTRDPKSTRSSLQKFVDKNAEAAPPGFQLPPGVTPATPTPVPAPPLTGNKFYDALAIGKQKVTDELKNVMDEDLAVAAADKLDLAGRGLYKIPGASTLVALFSAPVRGGLNEQGRDIGKATYETLEKAKASAREEITPIVRAFEKSGLFDENRLVAAGMTKDQAISELNKRDMLVREFLEYDPAKAVKPMPALPPELAALTPELNKVRSMLDGILKLEQDAGIDLTELQDKYLSYFPRYRRHQGKYAGKDPNRGGVVDLDHSAQNARTYRDLPGGVRVVQDVSLDPKISGIVKREAVVDGVIPEGRMEDLRHYVALKYGHELEEGFTPPAPGTKMDTRFDKMILSMANLDPFHVQDQMPIFGRSLMDDLNRRLQDGYQVHNNARTAQELLGKTALTNEVAIGKVKGLQAKGASEADALRDAPQGYTVTKVLKDLKFTKAKAWENTIEHMQPEAIAQRDGMLGVRRADVDALAAGESIILDTIDEGKVKLTREANGDFSREVQKLGSNGKPVKGQATKQIVPDGDIDAFIRQEQNAEFLNKFQVDSDIHTQVTRWIKPFSNPDEVNGWLEAIARYTNVTKSLWTAPWPAFHMRNRFSGMINNWMLGATDPTAKNPVMKLLKPEFQADDLRNGKVIKGIADEIPILKGMTDDAATEKLSDLAFKHMVTSNKMGILSDHIGDSHAAMRSAIPGLNKEVQPMRGLYELATGRFKQGMSRFSPAPAGTDKWDAANPLAVRSGWSVGKEGVKNFTDDAFLPARIGSDVASYIEDLNRLAPFIAYLKQGFSPAEAAKMSKRNQVDYGALSGFEKKYARLAIPFYSFSKGMLPVVLQELFHNPGGPMGQTLRGLNRSRSEDGMVPDYIAGTAAIPFGEKPDGTKSYLTGLGLGFEDSLNLMEGVFRGQPEETAKNVLARSNPLIKGTVEGITGRSLYFDGPGGGRELTEMDPPLGRTLSNIKDLATGTRTEEAEPFINSRFEFLMSNSPAARAVSTFRTLTDPRKVVDRPIDTALNLLTGFRVRDLSPAAQDYAYKEKLAEALKDSGAREFRRSYLPDTRAEKLGEEEMALVDRMLSELKVLDRRQKIRREQAEVAEQAPPNGKINSALFKQ